MRRFDMMTVKHDKYGNLDFRIVDVTDGIMTLWCEPLPEKKPFDDPSKRERHRYINYRKVTMKGDNPDIFLIEPDVSESLHTNITQYGCNQWGFSSLRNYLNTEFINGFNQSFIERIVKTENSFTIFTANSVASKKTPEDRVFYIDSGFSAKAYLRNGRCYVTGITSDSVYLPSLELLSKLHITNQECLFLSSDFCFHHYWLMNPYLNAHDEFSVACITQCMNETDFYALSSFCNANSMNTYASPVIRIKTA